MIVLQVNAPKYFVIGNVTRPGTYPLRSETSDPASLVPGRGIHPVRIAPKHQADPEHGRETGGPEGQLQQDDRRGRGGELPPQVRRHDRGAVRWRPKDSLMTT